MKYRPWNQTPVYVDLVVLILKCLVAGALIGHAYYIKQIELDPIYGNLQNEDYYTVSETKHMFIKTSLAAGCFVLSMSIIGFFGRIFAVAPAYGLYYCSLTVGFAISLLACITPLIWSSSSSGYCRTAEASCMSIDTLAECPFAIATLESQQKRFLLDQKTCCFLPNFIDSCSEFVGAAYTHGIIAATLAALVMTQSMVSCFTFCCDCDGDWKPYSDEPTVALDWRGAQRRKRKQAAAVGGAAAAAAAAAAGATVTPSINTNGSHNTEDGTNSADDLI